MDLSAAVAAAVATLRRRPSDLLPFYLLGAAIPVIVRAGTFLGLGIVYAYLEVTGRLDAVRAELPGLEPAPPNPETNPEAFVEWMDGLVPVLELLVTPLVVVVLAITIVLSILLSLVLYAGVTAGQLAACFGRLRDERGLTAGIVGVRRHWRSFLGLFVLEGLIWLTVSVLSIAFVVLAVGVDPVLGILVGFVAFGLWVAIVAVVRAIFAFAPVAVVVDGVGVFGSVRESAGFVRRRLVEAVGYYVLALAAVVGMTVLLLPLSVAGAGSVVALVGLLVVTPALDLVKTALYGGYRDAVTAPAEPVHPIRGQVRMGAERGVDELVAFVRETPGLHLLSVAVMVVGFGFGWVAAGPFVGLVDTSIGARLAGLFPPTATLEYFSNNWIVAFSTAFSGIALAIPALVSLWFNGLVFGIYARLEVEPVELLLFVVPHGVLELPALFVSGAVGLYLGIVAFRTWRNRATRATLADALERAFWVLVGVGLLLALAAVIEGFVSPYYFGPFV